MASKIPIAILKWHIRLTVELSQQGTCEVPDKSQYLQGLRCRLKAEVFWRVILLPPELVASLDRGLSDKSKERDGFGTQRRFTEGDLSYCITCLLVPLNEIYSLKDYRFSDPAICRVFKQGMVDLSRSIRSVPRRNTTWQMHT